MKKIAWGLFVLLMFPAIHSFAQTAVEFIPQAGYTFAARNDFYDDYGRVADGLNLGGALNLNITRNFGFEVLYNHQSTSSGVYNYGYDGGEKLVGGDLNQDFIMGGFVVSSTIPWTTVRPFLGFLLGADIITPMTGNTMAGNNYYASNAHFAAGLQLGTNIYLSPHVGIQLKAQLLSPVNAAGDAYYYSNYYGGGINPDQGIYSFSLGAGLIIGLGRVLPSPVYHSVSYPRPRYHRYYYYY